MSSVLNCSSACWYFQYFFFSTNHLHFPNLPISTSASSWTEIKDVLIEAVNFLFLLLKTFICLLLPPDTRKKWLPPSSTVSDVNFSTIALEISSQNFHHQLSCYLSVFNLSISTHSTLLIKCFLLLKSPTLLLCNQQAYLSSVLSSSPTTSTLYLSFLSPVSGNCENMNLCFKLKSLTTRYHVPHFCNWL